MFKKRQTKNFRRKHSDDDEDRNGVGDTRSDSESRGSNGSISMKDQPKKGTDVVNPPKAVPSTSSLLSFGDEEEEEVFQIRKSAASRNLDRSRQRTRAVENTRAEEKSLSKAFESLDHGKQRVDKSRKEEKKAVKIERSDSPVILDGGDVEDSDDEQEPVMGKFKEVLTSGAIPDANLIHLARKQRQMAREMGTTETPGSYIPVKKVDDTQKYKKEKSRLVREDDENENSDSGEEGGRFYSRLRDEDEEERRQVEADFLRVEQGDSDDEKDDELDRWEREQIRKGVSRNQIGYYGQDYVASNYGSMYGDYEKLARKMPVVKEFREPQPMDIDMDLAGDDDVGNDLEKHGEKPVLAKVGGSMKATAEPTFSLNDVKAKLEERRNEFAAAHRNRLLDREKVRQFLIENETTASKLEDSVPQLRVQYQFYQEMKTYVRDLLDCFDEKMPIIEKLETRMLELWAGRSQFLIKRRQQDTKDQYDECSAASLGKSHLLQQNSDRAIHAAEREARRTRRRQAREKTLAGLGHHEGMSSDDEEAPSRIVNFSNETEKIRQETSDVFKDTVEDFCSTKDIVLRFVEWRKLYREAFDQAFIIYCLPKLLVPLIRWQMLAWNPLESESTPLKTIDWYKALETVEQSQRDGDNEFELILPALNAAVLPRVKDIVEYVWDPTSTSQTTNLVAFLAGIGRDRPKSGESGKNLSSLKEAIYSRTKRCFDDDLFTPIYSKELLENKATGASSFLDRQFWFSVKVMQNVAAWSGVFSDQIVQELFFDGIVNRHVVLALQCGGSPDSATLTKCKAVCNALPSSWLADLKEGESLRQLEPLCKLLVRIADEFNSSKAMDKSTTKDATKEIYRLLTKLRSRKYADMISQKYRIK